MRLNLPNTLTVLRIFLVPLLVVVLLTPPMTTSRIAAKLQGVSYAGWIADGVLWFSMWREIIGVAIFLTAAATDWLDGFLARRRNEVTTLGILLDPIADKLLTSSAFISLVELQLAPAWMIVVIIGREFAISGMRSIAATRGVLIPASWLGKFKTASQVVAITLMILTNTLDRWGRFGWLGVTALWIALILAVGSAVDYFVKFFRDFELEART
jgi:CDP-diacylglycerol--glycerol-3-phosphate 3-phosphatidyltransferase